MFEFFYLVCRRICFLLLFFLCDFTFPPHPRCFLSFEIPLLHSHWFPFLRPHKLMSPSIISFIITKITFFFPVISHFHLLTPPSLFLFVVTDCSASSIPRSGIRTTCPSFFFLFFFFFLHLRSCLRGWKPPTVAQ